MNFGFIEVDLGFKSVIYAAGKTACMKIFGNAQNCASHSKSLLPLLALLLLVFSAFGGILFSPLVHATKPSANKTTPKVTDGISTVTLPASLSDEADYDTACPGGLAGCTAPSGIVSSWSDTIFSVTYTGTLAVTITDCCYEGDYYSLWSTTASSGLTGWTLVGTTDQVFTGPQLVAPTYDAYWTGTGTQYSSTTFFIPVSGTTLFADTDDLLNQMASLLGPYCGGASTVVYDGCTYAGPPGGAISAAAEWSPAGYYISFAAASSSGCLTSGATSWPGVTFTDGSIATVSVTGGVLSVAGTCPSMTIEDLFTSNPITTAPSVTSPNYYDLSITGLSAGTASLCLNFTAVPSLASASTGMWYWNGESWVSATSVTYTSPILCGDIPVSYLDTPSTPVVIGTSTAPIKIPTPEFGLAMPVVAAVGLLAFALVRKKTVGHTGTTT